MKIDEFLNLQIVNFLLNTNKKHKIFVFFFKYIDIKSEKKDDNNNKKR